MARYSRTVLVEWMEPLVPLTPWKILGLCRVASYTLLLSNSIRRDVLLVNRFSDGYLAVFKPWRLRGLRMDEESCTGLIRRAILYGKVPGVELARNKPLDTEGCCSHTEALRECCDCIRLPAPLAVVGGVRLYAWFLAAVILMRADVVCGE
ncbi:MAG: hypothetical protein GXO09_05550 [Crenarchaeota archaeon]|nr:hypothetical protein [Thermoproteota archaeon]